MKIFQIWIQPNELGAKPSYATRQFPGNDRSALLTVLASGFKEDASNDPLPLRANARLLASRIEADKSLSYNIEDGHQLYLVPSVGSLLVNGVQAEEGDGVAIYDKSVLEFKALTDVQLVIVDLLS